MKNVTTPRNLAECQFDVGYTIGNITPESRFERAMGYVLAIAIGVGIAAVLFYGLSK